MTTLAGLYGGFVGLLILVVFGFGIVGLINWLKDNI